MNGAHTEVFITENFVGFVGKVQGKGCKGPPEYFDKSLSIY